MCHWLFAISHLSFERQKAGPQDRDLIAATVRSWIEFN